MTKIKCILFCQQYESFILNQDLYLLLEGLDTSALKIARDLSIYDLFTLLSEISCTT